MPERPQRTAVDRVVQAIFEDLLSGEIQLGGILNEAALADRFAVSRGPVREAVKQLQGRGIVRKEAYLKARVVALSLPEMIEIFQLREAVEGMAVRLATRAMSDGDLDVLLAAFAEARAAGRPVDLDLHVRLAEGSGNARIRALLCDELYYLLRLYRARSVDQPGRREDAFEEHWQILRAMRARDADLAESLMRAHIGRATRSLQDLLASRDAAARPQPRRTA